MRKKTQKRLFDNIFWYIIYLLPIIALIVLMAKNGDITFSLASTFDTLGMSIVSNNIVYSGLIDIFGVNGAVPLFSDYSLLMYFTYFIFVFLIHIVVDALLLLPRIVLNCGDKLGGED